MENLKIPLMFSFQELINPVSCVVVIPESNERAIRRTFGVRTNQMSLIVNKNDDGKQVRVNSIEAFCSKFFAAFLLFSPRC